MKGERESARRAPGLLPHILAAAGALLATVAIYLGPTAGLLGDVSWGSSVTTVPVFAALLAGAFYAVRTTPRHVWPWAAGVAVVFATAELAGRSMRSIGTLGYLTSGTHVSWVVLHWLGVASLAAFCLAVLFHAVDGYLPDDTGLPRHDEETGALARLVGALRSPERSRRRRAQLLVMGLLVLSRIPYLVVWWPGIVYFDALRAYSFARGTRQWSTYDPVGHSMLVGTEQWLGTHLGLGDAGGVAIASSVQVLTSTGAFAFMLARLAVWGLGRQVWAAAFAWCLFLPVFGLFSVSIDKDVPFASVFLVFGVCIGEIVLGPRGAGRQRWPWVVLAVTCVLAIGLRNNGVHVVLSSLVLLLVLLRHRWRPLLAVLLAAVVGFGLYVGPVYRALDVRPGPGEEAFSIPVQQLGRIARDDRATLTPAERTFLTQNFGDTTPEELGRHYVPWLADPMKLNARRSWDDHTLSEFLSGWARLVATYPGTAVEATLSNTAGYWAPGVPSYDGFTWWSKNDARAIHLDIPSGEPTDGLRAFVVNDSGFRPTKLYRSGLQDDGYLAVPLLGLLMSPSFICWLWLIAVVLVIRRRAWMSLAVFVPPAMLLLTFLAGPVSGGQRYSLSLFNALPLAVAAVLVTARRDSSSPTETPPEHADPTPQREVTSR